MTLQLITAPAAEPVTLAEAKLHLRVDTADEDALIGSLIAAARQRAEHELRRSLVTQTWERVLDAFPGAEIELGMGPVQSVTSILYADAAGITQTLASSAYVLDNVREPGWVLPAAGLAWPETAATVNAVRVRYVAGYGNAATVPSGIKQWMLLQIGAMYENRESVAMGSVTPMPFVSGLLDPWRVHVV